MAESPALPPPPCVEEVEYHGLIKQVAALEYNLIATDKKTDQVTTAIRNLQRDNEAELRVFEQQILAEREFLAAELLSLCETEQAKEEELAKSRRRLEQKQNEVEAEREKLWGTLSILDEVAETNTRLSEALTNEKLAERNLKEQLRQIEQSIAVLEEEKRLQMADMKGFAERVRQRRVEAEAVTSELQCRKKALMALEAKIEALKRQRKM